MKKTLITFVSLLIAVYTTAGIVTFKDWNGTVLSTQDVTSGEAAPEPQHPTRDGYLFTGWDNGFAPVYSNITTTAQYTELSQLSQTVEVYWPLCEHTKASVSGPIEPFAMTRSNMEDVLYSTTISNLVYPSSYGYDASHKVIMLKMTEAEAETSSYNPDVYAEFKFKAADIVTINQISLLVGSTGWDNYMRFRVMYSMDDYFDEPVLLAETNKLPKDVMTEIKQNVNITVQAS